MDLSGNSFTNPQIRQRHRAPSAACPSIKAAADKLYYSYDLFVRAHYFIIITSQTGFDRQMSSLHILGTL